MVGQVKVVLVPLVLSLQTKGAETPSMVSLAMIRRGAVTKTTIISLPTQKQRGSLMSLSMKITSRPSYLGDNVSGTETRENSLKNLTHKFMTIYSVLER